MTCLFITKKISARVSSLFHVIILMLL